MNDKIYLHTINNGYSDFYKPKRQKYVLESILKSGKVLSRRKQGYKDGEINTNFAGMDYISLSDYEKRFVCNKEKNYYNSYYAYVRRGLSLSFPQESLKVIEPTIIGICNKNSMGFVYMRELGLCETERFTDLPDEVQAKDEISLDSLNGITFPTREYMCSRLFTGKKKMLELMREEIDSIKELLDKYNYNVDVYDIDTLELINRDNMESLALRK